MKIKLGKVKLGGWKIKYMARVKKNVVINRYYKIKSPDGIKTSFYHIEYAVEDFVQETKHLSSAPDDFRYEEIHYELTKQAKKTKTIS